MLSQLSLHYFFKILTRSLQKINKILISQKLYFVFAQIVQILVQYKMQVAGLGKILYNVTRSVNEEKSMIFSSL